MKIITHFMYYLLQYHLFLSQMLFSLLTYLLGNYLFLPHSLLATTPKVTIYNF